MDSKSPVKSPSENEVAMPSDISKSRRTHYRRLASLYCKRIEAILAEQGSRRVVKALPRRAQDAFECSEKLNDELTCDLDAEEAEAELGKQLNYLQKLEQTAEAVDTFLWPRAKETLSDVSQLESDNDGSSVSSDDTATQGAKSAHAEALEAGRSETPQLNAENVVALQAGHLPTDATMTGDAPDRWIDECVAGYAVPNVPYGRGCRRSTVRAEMDSYDGTASKWFSWIDLFKALVHDTAMSPGEKLAVLRSSLKGDCRDLVYGLGGGEDAYKEALRSLKVSCGRRYVIRAAHLQALDRLGPGKSPSQLKRFAERARTWILWTA
ncbi:hypothetical protein M513_10669 [Trichuris suis]|nr:hypothetical protein M513_10669 [Trichuris suis]